MDLPVVLPPPLQHPHVPVMLSHDRQTYNGPFWRCFLACIAVLVTVVLYNPKSPKLAISDASLNAGYVEHTVRSDLTTGPVLNGDITVLALVYSNNTKVDVVLRYMELGLYFRGKLLGTQVLLPAPLRERPRSSEPRGVHFVVSKVALSPEDSMAWQNMIADGLVELQLAGRFRTHLIIGPLLRYTYWVYPHCTLWFDPPPSGLKRHSSCYI